MSDKKYEPVPSYPKGDYPRAEYPTQPTYGYPNAPPPQMLMMQQQPPIMMQPGYNMVPVGMMPGGQPPLIGLDALADMDTIIVKQKIDELEMHLNIEQENRYVLKKPTGEVMFFAKEHSNYWMRQCCGNSRGFKIVITDRWSQDVITVVRPFKCCGGKDCCACIECCATECDIATPQGVIAHMRQICSCCNTQYEMEMADSGQKFHINGPCDCRFCTCSDKKFEIRDSHGNEVGAITKTWKGCLTETFSDADNFKLTFPLDMNVKGKAAIIGATFLIDFMHFETPGHK